MLLFACATLLSSLSLFSPKRPSFQNSHCRSPPLFSPVTPVLSPTLSFNGGIPIGLQWRTLKLELF